MPEQTIEGQTNIIDIENVVVGSGPAGLAVGACLRRSGFPFVILEKTDCVAHTWHNHYERLHLHTIKAHSGLPHMPFPASYPRYPSRLQVIAYLDTYAKRYQLEPRFGQQVMSVRRQNGAWETRTQDTLYQSQNVVLATGYNQQPNLPTWTGQELFRGQILHSSEYKNGHTFRDKRVLVVGFGNSGAEIAIDLWENGAHVGLSVRNPVNIIFRDLAGIPVQWISILMSPLPPRVIDALTAPLVGLLYGDLARYGLRRLPYGAATLIADHSKIPVIDVGTARLIRQGQIKVYPGTTRLSEKGVVFTDGDEAAFDSIVLATGYRTQLSALLQSDTGVLSPNGYPTSSGRESAAPGLYFCGFANKATGLLREIGIEAQRIAQSIAASNSSLTRTRLSSSVTKTP